MLIIVFLITSIIILNYKKKIFTFLGMTYVFSCIYVYFGLIYVNEFQLVNSLQYYVNFKFLFLLHFVITFKFSNSEIKFNNLNNNYKNIFLISSLFVFYYFIITISSFTTKNMELNRLVLFFDNKLLYYNILFIWPFLFLNQKKVKLVYIFIYISTCYLTGFRSLLVNFLFLYTIKEVLVFNKKIFNFKLLLFSIIIISAVFFISYYRTDSYNLQQALIHRIFIVNAENIYSILELNDPIYFNQFFRDFVPIRYLFNNFLDLNLTTAEFLTKNLNYYYFETGRIMTPTSLGLTISAFGKNAIYLYPIFLMFMNLFINKFIKASEMKIYLIFISISMVTRGVWSVFGLYFFPVMCLFILFNFLNLRFNSYVKYNNSIL